MKKDFLGLSDATKKTNEEKYKKKNNWEANGLQNEKKNLAKSRD